MKAIILGLLWLPALGLGQTADSTTEFMKDEGLRSLHAYAMLHELTTTIGSRLSGSEAFGRAVQWGRKQMAASGCDSVWLQPAMVPHWVRGPVESASVRANRVNRPLAVCALGGSIGTPARGVTAEVVEVRSLEEVKRLGARAKGKIVFYNRPFDNTAVNTFDAYEGAVDQRFYGAEIAASAGAVAVLVRSMTNAIDNTPHTGAMRYVDSIPKIPAAAVSTEGANTLSALLRTAPRLTVTLRLSCERLPDVQGYNVIGELRGSDLPLEVVDVGGHLDSWDKGQGAHDDGAGVTQVLEAARLLSALPARPKRTIRFILYANEENGLAGGKVYAGWVKGTKEKHCAAIESDEGGFMPRGFGTTMDSTRLEMLQRVVPELEKIGAGSVRNGGGGADISTLGPLGVPMIGLRPDSQRYFDYHHSDNDTIDKVHPRELELGAIALAVLALDIAQNGL